MGSLKDSIGSKDGTKNAAIAQLRCACYCIGKRLSLLLRSEILYHELQHHCVQVMPCLTSLKRMVFVGIKEGFELYSRVDERVLENYRMLDVYIVIACAVYEQA